MGVRLSGYSNDIPQVEYDRYETVGVGVVTGVGVTVAVLSPDMFLPRLNPTRSAAITAKNDEKSRVFLCMP